MTNKNIVVRFGCYIYQEGLEYNEIKDIVIECERLGFYSVWLKDNFIPWTRSYILGKKETGNQNQNQNEPMLECWTTLSSLASITKRIRLGAILVSPYRSPSLLAKMLSTLDIISNGRIEFGLSAGWYQREFSSYGFSFPKGSVRVDMLEESIKIIKKMLTESYPSFKGKYYSIENAVCNPKPIQKPYPPIWIGGGGKKTLQLVAKHADAWNYGLCSYKEYLEKLSYLEHCCMINNRNYEDVIKGWQGVILLSKYKDELKNKMTKNVLTEEVWKSSDLLITGTPEKILKEISMYIDIGVRCFIIHFPDLPDIKSLDLFAKHIIQHYCTM